MPFVWVSGTTDFEAVGRSLQADETVAELEKRSSFEGEELYRMEWVTQIEIIVQLLLEEGASILNAYGTR